MAPKIDKASERFRTQTLAAKPRCMAHPERLAVSKIGRRWCCGECTAFRTQLKKVATP